MVTPNADSFHARHSDPNGDVIITASDGVCFKASSCKLFADTASLPETLGVGGDKDAYANTPGGALVAESGLQHFDLDFCSRAVEIFLDMVLVAEGPMAGANLWTSLAFADARDLLELAEFMQADYIAERARDTLYGSARTGGRARDLLVAASERNDTGMAHYALALMSGKVLASSSEDLIELLDRLRPEYQLELLRMSLATVTIMYTHPGTYPVTHPPNIGFNKQGLLAERIGVEVASGWMADPARRQLFTPSRFSSLRTTDGE